MIELIEHMSNKIQGLALQSTGFLPDSVNHQITKKTTASVKYPELDPHLQLVLAARKIKRQETLVTSDPIADRTHFNRITKTIATKQTYVGRVEDFYVVGDAYHDIKVRHYVPETTNYKANGLAPLLVFIHGGGFVVGNLDTVDEPCRMMCKFGEMQVLSVDYRLSPEHKAPAAIEDVINVLRWAHANAASLGVDPERICLGGDSAGGNLTAIVSQWVKGKAYAPAAQLLIYPTVDFVNTYPSQFEFDEGLFLSRNDMEHAKLHYLGYDNLAARAIEFSPLQHDVTELPPALVITAAFDVLRDEGEAYAQKLLDAGNVCVLQRVASLGHGFINLTAVNKASFLATAQLAHDFRMLIDGKLV